MVNALLRQVPLAAELIVCSVALVNSGPGTAAAQTPSQPASSALASYGVQKVTSITTPEYDALVSLARCDWADKSADCSGKGENKCGGCLVDAVKWVRNAAGAPKIAEDEPAVVFVGLGGANRIVLLGRNQQPHYRTFRGSDYFWAIYVEDSTSSFQTSIDVQFREHVPLTDNEEFDPAGTESDAKETRDVKIGYKRFKMRQAPVDVQVTFTRQGPTYGLRQWVRAYRASKGSDMWLAVGVMVPGRLLPLQEYDLKTPPSTNGERPTGTRVVEEGTKYRAFVTAAITWPRARDWVLESEGGKQALLRTFLTPEPQFGLGLPQDPLQTLFAGLSWPLIRPVRFSVGYTFIVQQALRDNFFVGQNLPSGTTHDEIRGGTHIVRKVTVGLSIDVVGR